MRLCDRGNQARRGSASPAAADEPPTGAPRRRARLPARRVLGECQMDAADALRLQAAVGYGLEDTQMIIESMAQVPVWRWGLWEVWEIWRGNMLHACCMYAALAGCCLV